ncbi:MAG TPA: acetyl-L-homoserine sulfhydrolase [Spirochaetia bacterium]|nr:acetyl-L-homoserine sulfhydrolase [Spirochaetia bacterium]
MKGFNTIAIHAGQSTDPAMPTMAPVYQSAAFTWENPEAMEDVFSGRSYGHLYSRISNPTVTLLEQKISSLENGIGAIAVSSGMSAIAVVMFTLTEAGDEIISSNALFGGTRTLFQNVFKKYNVKIHYYDNDHPEEIEKMINEKTRLIFTETIGNPRLDIPDFEKLAQIARKKNIPLIADSTISTPFLFQAKKHHVDIVLHSSTKYISGSGSTIGGVIVDTGNFNWQNFHFQKTAAKVHPDFLFLASARKNIFQNIGCALSPFNAWLNILGLDTLALRMEKHCKNAEILAQALTDFSPVKEVNFPGNKNNKYREAGIKYFNNRFGGLLTIKLSGKKECFNMIRKLKMVKNAANIGDSRTLIIHPASTIYYGFPEDEKLRCGVSDDLLRISAGLEDAEDIINDIKQAIFGG